MISSKEFTVIVDNTKHIVLSAIYKLLPSEYHHSIDDIVQETYIRIYKKLSSTRDIEKLESWIYVVSKNETLRMIKKLSSEKKKYQKLQDDDRKFYYENNSFWEKFDLEYLQNIIKRLPEKYSKVLFLSLSGKKESELSEELTIPMGTVKSRLSRGKEKLYKILKEDKYEYQ